MRLAYKFNIGNNENISSLCKISNNLYNQALYIFRETLSKEDKWLSYFELDSIMKNTKNLDGDINYRLLNATWATKEEFDKAPVVGYIVEGIGLVFTDREGHEVNA